MPSTAGTRDTGFLEGDQPEGSEAGDFNHGYFGAKTAYTHDGQEGDNYAATGYPADLTLPENDAGGQVQR